MSYRGNEIRFKLLSFLFVIALLMSCSSKVNIADIKNHPREYVGKEVTVEGEVSDIFSLVLVNYFTLKDSTGSINVITKKPLPSTGEMLEIKATVEYYTFVNMQVISLKELSDE